MMINKRLINTVGEAKKYIAGNVAVQWCTLAANIAMIFTITNMLQQLYRKEADGKTIITAAVLAGAAILIRFAGTALSAKMSFLAAKTVKKTLRQAIYQKLLRLGPSYKETVSSAEVVQVAVEGVEQLETYFGAYLPQLLYSMLAPLTLFAALSFVNSPAALVLLVCVPLIPITIAAIQTVAKKLLLRYWNRYTSLGDTFLENLQGLTTLKIYQADACKNEEMNREAEAFRKITMKVLAMQLNSVTVMDVIAYGGAALGIIVAALQYQAGVVSLAGGLAIILLSADFFIPMRLLGSYFHVATNGMAASDKIFRLLDLSETSRGAEKDFPQAGTIRCRGLRYSYGENEEVLRGIRAAFPAKGLAAIVGESGCGKSTLAAILAGNLPDYTGELSLSGTAFADISAQSLHQNITYVGFDSYLFKGTVRDNLLMGDPSADENSLWAALDRVNLSAFLRAENGLDTALAEKAANLSGGQRQRLSLARAIVHDSPVYIFDEVTSNIDVESEKAILAQIAMLAKRKTVLMITHRLANTQNADVIYVLHNGCFAEQGRHEELIKQGGLYARLWKTQSELENYKKESAHQAMSENSAGKQEVAV